MRFEKPIIAVLVAVLAGCASSRSGKPVSAELSGSKPEAQINFWHSLADEPVTTNDQAFHGLLLYLDNKDDSADYNARVETLKNRKMLPKGFNAPAEAGVQRGTLAVAIVRVLNIKGGVTMRVFGPSPRYATRELQYMSLYPAGAPYQGFSGTEFVGVIGRLEDYQRGDPANKPAADLPSEQASEIRE